MLHRCAPASLLLTMRAVHLDRPPCRRLQVHEKSILIPLLPVTLLAPVSRLARWMPAMAVFSMAPLLRRDGLTAASVAALGLWAALQGPRETMLDQGADGSGQRGKAGHWRHSSRRESNSKHDGSRGSAQERITACVAWLHERISLLGMCAAAAVCAVVAATKPPARYPFLHDAAFTCVSFVFFAAAMCDLAHQTYMC
jgi:alpha-1,3-glucosyltransferase